MTNSNLRLAVVVALLLWLCGMAQAATYYVDFSGGDDANVGTSAEAALKHSPGDTVLFKGGVVYYGEVAVSASGEKDKPIVFDGNTAGTWGTGKAVIDGGDPITSWKRCASAKIGEDRPALR